MIKYLITLLITIFYAFFIEYKMENELMGDIIIEQKDKNEGNNNFRN